MDKNECKKYIRRAFKKLISDNKSISISNMEMEMKKIINEQMEEYISYTKIAIHNMKFTANTEITLKDIFDEIDILPKIYSRKVAILRAKQL